MILENIIDFLATKEVLIILVIIGIILFVCFILWFIDFMKRHDEKKKLQNNTMELNKLVLEVAKENDKKSNINESNKIESSNIEKSNNKVDNKAKVEEVKEVAVSNVEEVIEPKKEDIVIEKGFTSPIEVQPIVVSSPKQEVVSNDSLVLNDKYEEKVEVIEPEVIVPIDTPKNEEDVIKYKDEVYTEMEAKQELERITEELKSLKEDSKENIELTKYETLQEENAIISLDELLAKGKSLIDQNEITQYEDDGNEPISIAELEERYNNSKKEAVEEIEVLEASDNSKEEKVSNKVSIDDFFSAKSDASLAYSTEKHYKPSPIISPIYGIEEPVEKSTTLELEDTATFPKMDEELRKTNEFLAKLRELKEKLD